MFGNHAGELRIDHTDPANTMILGDVNGDGWPDLLVGTHFGALLYVNVGGRAGHRRRPDGSEHTVSGIYRAIEPPDASGTGLA